MGAPQLQRTGQEVTNQHRHQLTAPHRHRHQLTALHQHQLTALHQHHLMALHQALQAHHPMMSMVSFCQNCSYWKKHPDAIVAAIGSVGNIGKTFGVACSLIVGKKIENLHDALSNTRTDGIGALIREGAAAYLNSIVNHKFPFTTQQVKDCIIVAATSDGAASAQAGVFKKANESHY